MHTSHADSPMFYAAPGPMTEPGEYAALLDTLPNTLPELVSTLQGLVVHIFWARRYGLELSEARQQEVTLRPLRRRLARLLELDSAPLTQERPLERRLVSNCRDHAVMITGMLIHLGIPARARCGFATYFRPDHFEDHWVVEAWQASQARWVRFDPQLDEMMCKVLQLPFNPLELPEGAFLSGGAAWLCCRQGQANPEDFGIFDMHGWDFILGNLYRDLLALNKVEILPWDHWNGMGPSTATYTAADWEQHDRLAELTCRPDEHFTELRALYQNNPLLQVPADWLL